MSLYYGNSLTPAVTPDPTVIVPMATSTAIASTGYFKSYIATASGITVTLMQISSNYKGGSLTVTNDSTGTITISTRTPDLISISGVTTNTTYLFSGETIMFQNNGTAFIVPTMSQQGMRTLTYATLPSTNIGPLFVSDMQAVYTYVNTTYFTGYRNILCGQPVLGWTVTPAPGTLDAVGASVTKTSYPGLWGYAQENSLNIASGSWVAGTWQFGDSGSTTMILPDARNMFFRGSAGATDPDTSSVKALGANKNDQMQGHHHQSYTNSSKPYQSGSVTGDYLGSGIAGTLVFAIGDPTTDSTHGTPRSGMETTPKQIAMYPRIHY